MAHRPADSTGRQRTPGRYRLADKVVSRMGYGAMQLSGDGCLRPARDRDEAVAVLRAAVDAGVDHIDTAQTYGAGVVNELIREALYPYPDELALVSKVAARRDEAGALLPIGRFRPAARRHRGEPDNPWCGAADGGQSSRDGQ